MQKKDKERHSQDFDLCNLHALLHILEICTLNSYITAYYTREQLIIKLSLAFSFAMHHHFRFAPGCS